MGLVLDPELDDGHYRPSVRQLCTVAWRKNLGGDGPKFGPAQPLSGIDARYCTFTAAVTDGPRRGVMVTHDYGFYTTFFEQTDNVAGKPHFKRTPLVSDSALLFGETNGCYTCDWDDDGDWDILTGSCYGWVRIQINTGTNEKPVFDKPRRVLADGKPIHFVMTGTFPDLKK